jgi:hypothetical protein
MAHAKHTWKRRMDAVSEEIGNGVWNSHVARQSLVLLALRLSECASIADDDQRQAANRCQGLVIHLDAELRPPSAVTL